MRGWQNDEYDPIRKVLCSLNILLMLFTLNFYPTCSLRHVFTRFKTQDVQNVLIHYSIFLANLGYINAYLGLLLISTFLP